MLRYKYHHPPTGKKGRKRSWADMLNCPCVLFFFFFLLTPTLRSVRRRSSYSARTVLSPCLFFSFQPLRIWNAMMPNCPTSTGSLHRRATGQEKPKSKVFFFLIFSIAKMGEDDRRWGSWRIARRWWWSLINPLMVVVVFLSFLFCLSDAEGKRRRGFSGTAIHYSSIGRLWRRDGTFRTLLACVHPAPAERSTDAMIHQVKYKRTALSFLLCLVLCCVPLSEYPVGPSRPEMDCTFVPVGSCAHLMRLYTPRRMVDPAGIIIRLSTHLSLSLFQYATDKPSNNSSTRNVIRCVVALLYSKFLR